MKNIINLFLLLIVLCLIQGCDNSASESFQGYIEGDFTYITADTPGKLTEIPVKRGEPVAVGAVLFRLDNEDQQLVYQQVAQELAAAIAEKNDLQAGLRPEEINILRAQLKQAQIAASLAKSKWQREKSLADKGALPFFSLKVTHNDYLQKQAIVDESQSRLQFNLLPAREQALAAKNAKIAALEAQLAQVKSTLNKRQTLSPIAGRVHDIYFTRGESVDTNHPIISLLVPHNIKVRFYIPQKLLHDFKPGNEILVSCDGCKKAVPVKIDYISTTAEFTPPVIYSQKRREKMLFLVEARPAPDQAFTLHPGQPVKVSKI
jgi:HlyD family secretion protein